MKKQKNVKKNSSKRSKSSKSNERPEVMYVMDMQRVPKKVMQAATILRDGSMFVKILPARAGSKTLGEAINSGRAGQLDSLRMLASIYSSLPRSRKGGQYA